MSNLVHRAISAIVLAPLVLAAIWFDSLVFTLLIGAAGVLMLLEWCRITGATVVQATVMAIGFGLVVAASTMDQLQWITMILGTSILAVMILALVQKRSQFWGATGLFYITVPCLLLVLLRQLENGHALILWLFAVVWATDIGGYAFGKTIGGPKLAPKVSPNKTWAGLLGGMLLAAVVGAFTAQLTGFDGWRQVAVCSGMLAIVAQTGDLFESYVKRRFNVKDSGALIPGHGGLLDRVDGILAVSPAVFVLEFAEWAEGVRWWQGM